MYSFIFLYFYISKLQSQPRRYVTDRVATPDIVPCGTFNIVNTGGRVRDVAPPQMCQSQSHHVTLGMTIGRRPGGEGPDRPGERERADIGERDALGGLSTPASGRAGGRREQLHRGTAKETGPDRARIGESGTLGSKVGLYTHTETHDPSYNLNVIIDYYYKKYTVLNSLIVYSSDYGH